MCGRVDPPERIGLRLRYCGELPEPPAHLHRLGPVSQRHELEPDVVGGRGILEVDVPAEDIGVEGAGGIQNAADSGREQVERGLIVLYVSPSHVRGNSAAFFPHPTAPVGGHGRRETPMGLQ